MHVVGLMTCSFITLSRFSTGSCPPPSAAPTRRPDHVITLVQAVMLLGPRACISLRPPLMKASWSQRPLLHLQGMTPPLPMLPRETTNPNPTHKSGLGEVQSGSFRQMLNYKVTKIRLRGSEEGVTTVPLLAHQCRVPKCHQSHIAKCPCDGNAPHSSLTVSCPDYDMVLEFELSPWGELGETMIRDSQSTPPPPPCSLVATGELTMIPRHRFNFDLLEK